LQGVIGVEPCKVAEKIPENPKTDKRDDESSFAAQIAVPEARAEAKK